jgi:hypothetical protein
MVGASDNGTNCEVFLQLEHLWARRWSCPSRSKLTRNIGSAQCGHVRVFVEIDKAANFVKGRTLDVRAAVPFCSHPDRVPRVQ